MMRIYLAIKYHEDNQNTTRIEEILAILEQHGFETCCIARDLEQWGNVTFEAKELMQRSFQEIDHSDMVLVDLTEKGVGIGIEAGYAFARQIPIITIAQTGSDISTTLQGISRKVLLYSAYHELAELLSDIK